MTASAFNGFGRRRRRRGAAGARLVLPPSADEVLLAGSTERQRILDSCDRSPALLRLTLDGDAIEVLFAGAVAVGRLETPSSPAFRRAIRRAERAGLQLWAHGQVERRGLDLCVVLRCSAPARPARLFHRTRLFHRKGAL